MRTFFVFLLLFSCKTQKIKAPQGEHSAEKKSYAGEIQQSFRDYQTARAGLPLQDGGGTLTQVDQLAQGVTQVSGPDFEILMDDPGVEALVIETHKEDPTPYLASLGAMSFVTASALAVGSYGIWKGQAAKKVLARIKPEDLGVEPIQTKLKKAQEELKAAGEALNEGLGRTAKMEGHLKKMGEALEKAESANRQLGESLAKAQAGQEEAQGLVREQERQIGDLKEQLEGSLKEKHKLDGNIEAIAKEKAELEGQIGSLKAELEEAQALGAESQATLTEQIEGLTKKVGELEAENRSLKESLGKSQETIEKARVLIAGLTEDYEKLGKNTDAIVGVGKTLDHELRALRAKVGDRARLGEAQLRAEVEEWGKVLDGSIARTAELNQKMAELKSQIGEMAEKNRESVAAIEEGRQELEKAREYQKKMETQLQALKDQAQKTGETNTKLQGEIAAKDQALEEAKATVQKMEDTVQRMGDEIEAAKENSRKLEENLDQSKTIAQGLEISNKRLQTEIENIGIALDSAKIERDKLTQAHETIRAEKVQLEGEVQLLKTNLEAAQTALGEAKIQLESTQKELAALEEKIKLMNAQQGETRSLIDRRLELEREKLRLEQKLSLEKAEYGKAAAILYSEMTKKYDRLNQYQDALVTIISGYALGGKSYKVKNYEVIFDADGWTGTQEEPSQIKIDGRIVESKDFGSLTDEEKSILSAILAIGDNKKIDLDATFRTMGQDIFRNILPLLSKEEIEGLFDDKGILKKEVLGEIKAIIGSDNRFWVILSHYIKKDDLQAIISSQGSIVHQKLSKLKPLQAQISEVDLQIKGIAAAITLTGPPDHPLTHLREALQSIEKRWYADLTSH